MQQRDREIATLQTELSRHSRLQELASKALLGRVAHLEADVSALHTASALPLATPPSKPFWPALPFRRSGIL
jgi:hypothetical protein